MCYDDVLNALIQNTDTLIQKNPKVGYRTSQVGPEDLTRSTFLNLYQTTVPIHVPETLDRRVQIQGRDGTCRNPGTHTTNFT